MEENKLKELMERYWNAETTLEEEKFIEEYIISYGNDYAFKRFFLDKNAARKIFIPGPKIHHSSKVSKTHNAWIRKIAAIFAVLIIMATTVLMIKQKTERAAQLAAQKQLETDLNLMFNTINDSYNDISSTANYLTK